MLLLLGEDADVADDAGVVGVELLLLELLLQAATSNAAETAAAVSPAVFCYGIQRCTSLISVETCPSGMARSDPCGPISVDRALLVEMLDPRRETYLLTLP